MAYENDILTRNDDDELSVRVVQSTGDNPAVAYDDIYTRDDNGKLAVRVVGSGGDTHNKGYFATPESLRTAYPTAQPGDFAIVESTDTVWVWDSDTSDWKDGDTKGQVTSVNNQTGAVTVQETLVSGTNIKTVDGNSLLGSGNLELSTYLPFPNTWTTTGTTKALCDDIAADTTATKGKAYLGEVTCSDLPGSMANAEIVVEIMDGSTSLDKVIVLTCTSGNTAPYMWKYTYWDGGSNVSGWKTWQEPLVSGTNIKTVNNTSLLGSGNITIDSLPTQAGNSGKFLTTNGTDASWATVDALPSQTGQSGKFLTTDGTDASWSDKPLVNKTTGANSLAVGGTVNTTGQKCTAINAGGATGTCSTSIGYGARTGGNYACQIGPWINNDNNTFKFGNGSDNFEIISADGTIPTDRFTTTPVADGTYVPTLTISSGVATRTWAAPSGGGSTALSLTLAAANWSNNSITVTATGVTASNNVIVSPAPASQSAYTTAGVMCTAQAADSLTFTCTTTPSSDLTVTVLII